MEQQLTLQGLDYRALEGTNTKTRRLAYLTAVILTLRRNSLGKRLLLSKLLQWSQEHKHHLASYWVQTGEVTSTRRNSAGARYLHLATNLGLIAPIADAYRATRMGLVLFALTKKQAVNQNPFFPTKVEQLFYIYLLLERDADVLLTITDGLLGQPGIPLACLQRSFQENFLNRVSQKIQLSRDEILRQHLLERRAEVRGWKRPERYAEHIVPPRLNWLLDLDLLKPGQFRGHRYFLTETGHRFLEALPRPGNGSFTDVTDEWLASDFWLVAASELMNIEPLTKWNQVDETDRQKVCAQLLRETFRAFQHTVVPKVSLTQTLLYLSVKLILEHKIGAAPDYLREWLSSPRVLNGHRYEVRFSPRENASYVTATSL
jgi:hypothetical protein